MLSDLHQGDVRILLNQYFCLLVFAFWTDRLSVSGGFCGEASFFFIYPHPVVAGRQGVSRLFGDPLDRVFFRQDASNREGSDVFASSFYAILIVF